MPTRKAQRPVRCQRCGYEWTPKSALGKPSTCPNPVCRSPNWDKPRIFCPTCRHRLVDGACQRCEGAETKNGGEAKERKPTKPTARPAAAVKRHR